MLSRRLLWQGVHDVVGAGKWAASRLATLANNWFHKHRDYLVRDYGCGRNVYFSHEWHFRLRAFDVSIQKNYGFIPIICDVGIEAHSHHRFSATPCVAPN